MSIGKLSLVILATVVIFAAGVVTGSLVVRRTQPSEVAQPFWNRFEMTRRAIDSMPELTVEQRERIRQILRDNQELIAEYFRILEPDAQQVFRTMREQIREELTPAQRQRFDELNRRRNLRPVDRRFPDDFRRGPNSFPPDGSGDPMQRPPRRNEFPPYRDELPPPRPQPSSQR